MVASLIAARRVAIRSHNVLPTRLSSTTIYTLSFSTTNISSSATATNKTNTNTKSKYTINPLTALSIASVSLFSGYCIGTSHTNQINEINTNRELPSGETSGCCSCEEVEDTKSNNKLQLTEEQTLLPTKLQKIVGQNHVIDGTKPSSTNSIYLKGARLGHGNALCIVQPGTLKEVVKCLQLIVDAGCVVLPQGSNTGLTGG